MEDVDENVVEVHHNPAAGWIAIAVERADAFIAKTAGDFVGNRFEMRLGRAAANEKEVGHIRDAAHVQNHGVLGLLVEGDVAAKFGEFFRGEPASALH